MARILAIDYGIKRCGIAVTDPLQLIANSLTTVSTEQLMVFLTDYLTKETVEIIVLGLPKQLNNQPSETASHVNGFARRLHKQHPTVKIEMVDERFSSVLAHQAMLMGGLKKKDRQNKATVDAVSATIILQSYLESLKFKK